MRRWNFMRISTVTLSILIVLSILLTKPAKAVPGQEGQPALNSAVSNPNELILNGIRMVYDRRFTEAEGVFREVVVKSPALPAGYFYLAMVSWSRLTAGFWSPGNVSEFKKRIDTAIEKAETRIEQTGGDSYDFFYLGGALGFKGRFELMKGAWMSSYFLARDAINALEICRKLAPDNKDVLLGLGTFDYYTVRLSGFIKFITSFLLYKGDMKRGLERLNIAAKEAVFSSTETRTVLLHIYLFLEQDFENALPLSLELSNGFKNNPRFHVLKGVIFIRMGKDDMYRKTVDELLQKGLESKDELSAAMWGRRALYLEIIHDIYRNNCSQAMEKIDLLLASADPENDPAMIGWAILKKGMIYDLEGNRKKAMECYEQVIEMENASGVHFIAKKHLEAPIKQSSAFIGF